MVSMVPPWQWDVGEETPQRSRTIAAAPRDSCLRHQSKLGTEQAFCNTHSAGRVDARNVRVKSAGAYARRHGDFYVSSNIEDA
jgi:hypothetical protein